MKKSGDVLLLVLIAFFTGSGVCAQQQVTRDSLNRTEAVKVFIDCRRCDMNYLRNEVPYVNYVRDVREAEVYILETSQETGSGGRKYTFSFLGQQRFSGLHDTLSYISKPDDTRDVIRQGRTDIIKMGLMRYVARTPLYREVRISPVTTVKPAEVEDNWNNWVFELESEPRIELEESIKQISLENRISANRVTPEWKTQLEYNQDFSRTRYYYEDTTYTQERSSWSQENLLVKSLTNHWSTGVYALFHSSSYNNIKLGYTIAPAVEYDIFPYSESTHHQLRLLYALGFQHNQYNDTTIYNKIVEDLFQQQVRMAFQIQQKWGYVNVSLLASSYLNDFSKNHLELDGYIRVRLFKGLSFRVSGSIARINDQLSLVKGDLDETEVLLQIRELATAYRVEARIGIVYTFGSIYNNIVNPRFGD